MTRPETVEPSEKQRAAFAAGGSAYAAGFPSTVCPHPIVGPEEDREQLGLLWVRGYVQRRQATGVRELPPAPEPPQGLPTRKRGRA